MKIFSLLCITSLIGTGAFLAATASQNKFPAFVIGFAVWVLFIIYSLKKIRR
jgi:multisubunit Na+/H+ antiporter MnhC subunit